VTRLHCRIELPADYRLADFLAFHQRDPQEVAERVTADSLIKGLCWAKSAACLSIRFKDNAAEVWLDIDSGADPAAPRPSPSAARLEHRARLMLGLTQSVGEFEQQYRGHSQLGALIRRVPGLRIPLAASPFEALSWAIIVRNSVVFPAPVGPSTTNNSPAEISSSMPANACLSPKRFFKPRKARKAAAMSESRSVARRKPAQAARIEIQAHFLAAQAAQVGGNPRDQPAAGAVGVQRAR
jgi:hypothetical protein